MQTSLGSRLSNVLSLATGAAGVSWSGPEYRWIFEWIFYLSLLWAAVSICREGWSNRAKLIGWANTVEPSHVIILGLVIAFGGVVWQMRRATPLDPKVAKLQSQLLTATTALESARQTKPQAPPSGDSAETIKKLQADLAARNEELAAAKRQVEAQKIAAVIRPPEPPSPYPAGPILQQPFSREQAQKMLDALGDMAEAATRVSKTLDVPMIYFPPLGGILGRDRWAIQIAKDGFEKTTEVMNAFDARVSGAMVEMNQVIEKYPSIYSGPLQRILGQTGLAGLQQSTKAFTLALNEIQRLEIKPEKFSSRIVQAMAGDSAKRLTESAADFRMWSGTFVQERYPTAQRELEKFLK